MAKTFEDLMVIAKKVYADSRHQDQDHAKLTVQAHFAGRSGQ